MLLFCTSILLTLSQMLHFNLLLLFFLFQLHNIEIIIFTMRYIFFSIFCVVVVWQVLVGFQFFVVVRFSFPVTLCVIAKFFFSYNVSLAKFVIFPLQCASCKVCTPREFYCASPRVHRPVQSFPLATSTSNESFKSQFFSFWKWRNRCGLFIKAISSRHCICTLSGVELERCTVPFHIDTSHKRGNSLPCRATNHLRRQAASGLATSACLSVLALQ